MGTFDWTQRPYSPTNDDCYNILLIIITTALVYIQSVCFSKFTKKVSTTHTLSSLNLLSHDDCVTWLVRNND